MSPDTLPNPNPAPRKRSKGALVVGAVLIAAAAAMTGAFASKAVSAGAMRHGFWHGHGATMSPAQMGDRADRLVRHLAVEIDATAEQQEKLRAIVKGAVADLAPTRDKILAARQQARDLLTEPTVNRAGMEKLRAEQAAQFEAISKRLTQALADTAEVLTPEQRRKLNDILPPAGFRPGWHRG